MVIFKEEQRDILQVMFYDDVFTVNPRWLKEFAPKYKEHVGLPFWCYTYPTTTRKEDLLLLKDAGMRSMPRPAVPATVATSAASIASRRLRPR